MCDGTPLLRSTTSSTPVRRGPLWKTQRAGIRFPSRWCPPDLVISFVSHGEKLCPVPAVRQRHAHRVGFDPAVSFPNLNTNNEGHAARNPESRVHNHLHRSRSADAGEVVTRGSPEIRRARWHLRCRTLNARPGPGHPAPKPPAVGKLAIFCPRSPRKNGRTSSHIARGYSGLLRAPQ